MNPYAVIRVCLLVLLGSLNAMVAFAQAEADEKKINFSFKAIAFSRVPGLDEVFYGDDEEK